MFKIGKNNFIAITILFMFTITLLILQSSKNKKLVFVILEFNTIINRAKKK